MFGFKNFRQFKNFFLTVIKIILFIAHATVVYLFSRGDISKRKRGMRLTQKYSKDILKQMSFEVIVKGKIPDPKKNYFFVCNHMSYIDILVLSSIRSSMFVTSVEMQHTPLLGQLSKLGGSYFVERRNKIKLQKEIEDLSELLKNGLDVFVFPEGTSTNGQNLLPFKRALFQSAILANKEVLPICLLYETIDAVKFSPNNADKVCWYGDMDFLPHLMGLMDLKKVIVSVEYLEPITCDNKTKEELSQSTENIIRSTYLEN